MIGLAILLGLLLLATVYACAWDRSRQPRGPVCGTCKEAHR